MANVKEMPDGLPAPRDDGASDHLAGMTVPQVSLRSTRSRMVELSTLGGTTVIYAYPMTGRPDTDLPDGWDEIPGARGCTPQSCAFRDHLNELRAAGADHVFGVSTQTSEYQREAADRLHLPFELLSDAELVMQKAFRLPTFQTDIGGENPLLLKRLTIVLREGKIAKVFYPVFPPDRNAADVIAWLRSNPT